MSGLIPIANTENPDRAGEIIFVHGLGGDGRGTWQQRGQEGSFWPSWLGEDFPNLGIWSFDYPASPSRFGHTMPLYDRARHLFGEIETRLTQQGKPLVFITHSMGGLVVVQMLHTAHERDKSREWQTVARRVRGIMFLGTPHRGSRVASWLASFFPRLSSRSTMELQEGDAYLRKMADWFERYLSNAHVYIQQYCETRPTKGTVVVNPLVAQLHVDAVELIPTDEDHVSICKPVSRQSLIYAGTKEFIAKCIPVSEPKDKHNPFNFRVDDLYDDCIVRKSDIHHLKGTCQTTTALRAYVLLGDSWGNMFAQYPRIKFLPNDRWSAENILPGKDINCIYFGRSDEQTDIQLQKLCERHDFGALPTEIVDRIEILESIRISLIEN